MSKGTEKLFERIYTIEFDSQEWLKSYDRLTDRVSLQKGSLYTVQIMPKDEMLSLKEKLHTLKPHVQNKDQKLGASVKSLEIYTGQEIQALHKTVGKRFKMTEEIIRADEQGDKVQWQNLTSPVHVRARDDLPRVLANYPMITSDKKSIMKYTREFKECKWKPIGMKNLQK